VKVLDTEKFQQKRKELELTQRKVAKILGVKYSVVNAWERGRASPRPKNLQKIVELLGKDVLREKVHTNNEKLSVPTEKQYKEDVKRSLKEDIDEETAKRLEEEANYLSNIRNVFLGRV
jgi:transcriptional regulator with XRE-family HTH domain